MIYSMTGFGKAEGVVGAKQVTVELKSLNGKQFDLNAKLPPVLRAYESDLRSLLSSQLYRGTIDCSIIIRQDGASRPMVINTELAVYYYQGIQQIASQLDIPEDNVLATLLRLPEIVTPEQDIISDEEWADIRLLVEKASTQLMDYRREEGSAIHKDIGLRIHNILKLLEDIHPLEGQRTDKIRNRINQSLRDAIGIENIDANRFEQEMIYFLERIDFSEEKSRLTQHCDYFFQITGDPVYIAKGKKIGFILQEIGREVNTLGAKANHADIQQLVIGMKDELEKAKEQVLNIL